MSEYFIFPSMLDYRSDLLTVSLNYIFIILCQTLFSKCSLIRTWDVVSEFVMCFATDPIGRHFEQGDIRMQEYASCRFLVWELPFLVSVPFPPPSSALPNTSYKLLIGNLSSTRLCSIVLENCWLEILSFWICCAFRIAISTLKFYLNKCNNFET